MVTFFLGDAFGMRAFSGVKRLVFFKRLTGPSFFRTSQEVYAWEVGNLGKQRKLDSRIWWVSWVFRLGWLKLGFNSYIYICVYIYIHIDINFMMENENGACWNLVVLSDRLDQISYKIRKASWSACFSCSSAQYRTGAEMLWSIAGVAEDGKRRTGFLAHHIFI